MSAATPIVAEEASVAEEVVGTEQLAAEQVEPTAEPPTAVPEPTEEPTIEPTPEPAGPALPEGLCANPYFPVIEGAKYTYRAEIPDFGDSTYSFTFANVTANSFDMTLGNADEDLVAYTWQCLEDGLLSPSFQINTGGPGVTIETIEASGLTFPAPENVAVGYTWTSRYVFNTAMEDTGFGAMDTATTVEMTNEIVAIEPVSTAFGDFDEAVKIESTGTMAMTTIFDGEALPEMTFDMTSTSWYVEGIGRVRTEDFSDMMGTGEGVVTVTELVSIE